MRSLIIAAVAVLALSTATDVFAKGAGAGKAPLNVSATGAAHADSASPVLFNRPSPRMCPHGTTICGTQCQPLGKVCHPSPNKSAGRGY